MPKRLFLTIGATAPFNPLIRASLSHAFLSALQLASYTELRIQHGSEGAHILREADLSNILSTYGISVTGFDFDKTGLESEMRAVKANKDGAPREEGAIISHAGSGSILDAMRLGVPLIVVPNEELLGNHQVELAEVLEGMKYVVWGKVEDLAAAVPKVEGLRREMRVWPPTTKTAGGSGEREERYRRGLKGVLDEEMGWATRVG